VGAQAPVVVGERCAARSGARWRPIRSEALGNDAALDLHALQNRKLRPQANI